jgi:hypothetical protein
MIFRKQFDKQEEIRIDLPTALRGVYLIKITDSDDKKFEKL